MIKLLTRNFHSHNELKPTGDPELDRLARQKLQKELARLQRNTERRIAREKQKQRIAAVTSGATNVEFTVDDEPLDDAGSPTSDIVSDAGSRKATPQKTGKGRTKDGTARKCANCGQVGHIKTNRKSVNSALNQFACRCTSSSGANAGGRAAADTSGQRDPRGKDGAFTTAVFSF